jgi:hypothetical protein
MHDRIIQTLHQTSTPELIATIEKAYLEAGDDQSDIASSIAETLAKRAKLPKLSSLDLTAVSKSCLSWSPLSSPRIILCGSRDQISDLQIGDTIITSEGVWQILPGFQEQIILSKKELSAIPIELQPTAQKHVTVIESNDEPITDHDEPDLKNNKLLTIALNKACVKKPNSLYVCGESSPAVEHAQEVIRKLKQEHLDNEIAHRNLFEILYKVSKVKTDVQFTQYAEKTYQEFLALHAESGTVVGADEYKTYLAGMLPNQINFSKLSDQDLEVLSYSGYEYIPARSERIYRAQSIESINDNAYIQIGDTFIVPNGVYQLDRLSRTQLILNAEEMNRTLPADMVPNDTTELETIEPRFTSIDINTSHAVQLPLLINQATAGKPDAMRLGAADSVGDDAEISTTIFRAGSLDLLRGPLSHGPTYIVQEGIFQVGMDNRLHRILSQEKMRQSIPDYMLPNTTTLPEQITCLDSATVQKWNQNTQLTKSLITGFANKPHALYLGSPQGEAVLRIADISSSLHYLAEQERHRRQLKTNLILKVFNFKTDADFMNYFVNLLYLENSIAQKLTSHIDTILQKSQRINLAILTDAELRTLCQQCSTWSPKISSRILCCRTLPENARIGDTVILPNGVYQIRIDERSGKIKPEKVINQAELSALEIDDFIPEEAKKIRIIADYDSQDARVLISALNPIIHKHKQGMYLHEIPGRESESYGAVTTVLKKMAEKELATRALNRLKMPEPSKAWFSFSGFGLGLFGSTSKVVPMQTDSHRDGLDQVISNQSQPKKHSQMHVKALRKGINQLKELQQQVPPKLADRLTPSSAVMFAQSDIQPAAPRSIPDIQASMNEITKNLNFTLEEQFAVSKSSSDEQTVKILQDHRVFMEASPDTVAMYKPLLQSKLKDTQKAELFLQALGIPPTQGKQKVEVRGGHHNLRVAIRKLFKQYKDQEHLQKELDQSGSETDTSSHESKC